MGKGHFPFWDASPKYAEMQSVVLAFHVKLASFQALIGQRKLKGNGTLQCYNQRYLIILEYYTTTITVGHG